MARIRILVINPNTTQGMTDNLIPLVESLNYTDYTFLTAPSGVPSINTTEDGLISAQACLSTVLSLADSHDAFLVACYSLHPLVAMLQEELPRGKFVTGIFQSSIAMALSLLKMPMPVLNSTSSGSDSRAAVGADVGQGGESGNWGLWGCGYSAEARKCFGIVSTGEQQGALLSEAVEKFLGQQGKGSRFAGVQTTGLNASELHYAREEVVKERMVGAARRFLWVEGVKVSVICLGCAGMVNMDEWVKEGAGGNDVKVVDGVKAGVSVLQGLCRGGYV
ncbi:hypothetical protein MMC25_000357 [Agyrium rufum]|nr:hypothetical protein [Agyrium rufum]